MKNKKIVIITIIAVLALVLITLGVTYAFFNYLREGTTENTIDSGSISFVYEEVNKIGNGIKIEDALPTSDIDGKQGNYFEFKVSSSTSVGNVEIPYEITGRITEESSYLSNYVKIYLTKVNGTIEEEKVLSMYNDLTDSTNQLAKEYNDKTIYKDYIPAGSRNYTEVYRLRMWLNEDVNDGNVIDFSEVNGEYPSQNKTFSMKINVYANGNKASNEKVVTANTTTIESIEANNVTALLNEDSNNNYDYYLEVEAGTTNIETIINTTNQKATVETISITEQQATTLKQLSATKDLTLVQGDNYFKITVTSENRKNSEDYVLKIKVLPFCEYKVNDYWEFNYLTQDQNGNPINGAVEEWEVPCTGLYKLEVWGGKGRNNTTTAGAGGYSLGYKAFNAKDDIYIVCGSGNSSNAYNGGFGGATHIAKVTGTLASIGYDSFVTQGNGFIVAGGGGSSLTTSQYGTTCYSGAGGGLNGGSAYYSNYDPNPPRAQGGSQTDAGTCTNYTGESGTRGFGQGGDNWGGGGLYGGARGASWGGSGGGSGYIGGVPEITYKETVYSPSMQSGINSGAGKAKITLIEID